MSDEPESMVLELQRAIRSEGDKTRTILAEAVTRLASLEISVAAIRRDTANDAMHAAEEGHRLDGVMRRIEILERRLKLRDQ